MEKNLLEVNNIEVVYNDIIQVLRGVSLNVPKGSIVALLEPTVPVKPPLCVPSQVS